MDKHLIAGEVLLISVCILSLCMISIPILVVKLFAERKKNSNLLSERKAMVRCMIPVLEMERANIAKDVHDNIGSILSILKLNISQAQSYLLKGKNLKELIDKSAFLADEAIKSAREISFELMPSSLIHLGFETAIVEFCRQINVNDLLNVSITIETKPLKFNQEIELQLFRIVQEVLNNIVKHEAPSAIVVCIRNNSSHALEIDITHTGKGISQEMIQEQVKNSAGIGLKSVLTRIELMQGSIHYSAYNNKNSEVKICIPLHYDEINQTGHR